MVSLVQGFPTKGEIHSRGEFLGFRGTDWDHRLAESNYTVCSI